MNIYQDQKNSSLVGFSQNRGAQINQGRNDQMNSNRIQIEQQCLKDNFTCTCSLKNPSKNEKKCQTIPKCQYDTPTVLHQNNTEISIYTSNKKSDLQGIDVIQRVIDTFKDYNQVKDKQGGGKPRIRCLNYCIQAENEPVSAFFIKNKQPRLAQIFSERSHNEKYQSIVFRKLVLYLQETLDNILQGDPSISFIFTQNFEQKDLLHHVFQFIQASNQREMQIEFLDSQSSDTGPQKLKKDDFKLTFVTIQRESVAIKPSDEQLQFINLYYDETEPIIKPTPNSFNVHIDSSLNSLRVALKYFIKEKIKNFQPSVIVLNFKLSLHEGLDAFVFYKLVRTLKKFSQGRLIVIPLMEVVDLKYKKQVEENFISCTNCCFRGCFGKENVEKLPQEKLFEYYQVLHPQFCESAAQMKMYKLQLRALRIQRQSTEIVQETRQFPLIDSQGGLGLADLGQVYDETCQHIVDYNQANIEIEDDYDGTIILIQKTAIFLFQFKETKSKKQTTSFQIGNKSQLPLPNGQNGVYYYDEGRKYLYYFFGIQNNQWSSDIQYIDIRGTKWETIQWKKSAQLNLKQDDAFINNPEIISKLLGKRQSFSVSQNQISGLQNSSTFVCLGGTYTDESYRYGCILQEISISFRDKHYTTKILQKSKIDFHYRESPNPLVVRINESSLLYFENGGNFSNPNSNPSIRKINFWKGNQYLVQTSRSIFSAGESFQRDFNKNYQKLNSWHRNIRLANVDQQPERLFTFKAIIKQPIQVTRNQLEGKSSVSIFTIYTFEHTSANNQIQSDVKVFQVNSIKPMPTLKNMKDPKGLFQNAVENTLNTQLFHQQDQQYIVCYNDINRQLNYRRFNFESIKEQQSGLLYQDYSEILFQDWQQSKIFIARKVFSSAGCQLIVFECPFLNLQDAKDCQDDILFKVQVKKLYMIQNFKRSHELIGCVVEIKENTCEITILTSKSWYVVRNKGAEFTHEQYKHSSLNLNSRSPCLLFRLPYTQVQFGLFYVKAQFTQAQIKEISQNVILIKYILINDKKECQSEGTLKHHCDDPLPLTGQIEGKINNINLINEITIEIELLIKHKQKIKKEFIYCQVNEQTKQLDQVKLSIPKKSTDQIGSQIYELIQSNRKSEEYSFLGIDGEIRVSFD